MKKVYDLAIIGGGMAGLSAAINASAEGIKTVLLEYSSSFGGQAGSASLIENYLGFPEGVSGKKLTDISMEQAYKFGTDFINPFHVAGITANDTNLIIESDDDDHVHTHSIVIASGMSWKTIEAKNVSRFVGLGVQYGSPLINEDHSGKTIIIAGGANSAGQAAMFLSECKNCNVILLIRNASNTGTMSEYLANRVTNQKNITVCTEAEILEAKGKTSLEEVVVMCSGKEMTFKADKLYILIGGKPRTSWVDPDFIKKDEEGFIVAGNWGVPYETNTKGIFAVGDVRSGAVRRVSNAVGEGASCINSVRSYLQLLRQPLPLDSHG